MDEADAQLAFAALAQPTRLKAFRKLMAAHPAGVPAGEIAAACGVPHNTMSTHLAALIQAGLIAGEREGRAVNYRARVPGLRNLMRFIATDCCGGRPELCGDVARLLPDDADDTREQAMTPAFNVLFLCTRNSARSILAEAILNKIGGGRFRAYSAGSDPAVAPMPDVLERLKAIGHDVSALRCKSWNEFMGPDAPRMDFIIALCDTVEGQVCPDLGENIVTAAWPLPDPAKFMGADSERATLLNELYAMIRRRLEIFTSLPFASLDRMAVKARLDEIGDTRRLTA